MRICVLLCDWSESKINIERLLVVMLIFTNFYSMHFCSYKLNARSSRKIALWFLFVSSSDWIYLLTQLCFKTIWLMLRATKKSNNNKIQTWWYIHSLVWCYQKYRRVMRETYSSAIFSLLFARNNWTLNTWPIAVYLCEYVKRCELSGFSSQ